MKYSLLGKLTAFVLLGAVLVTLLSGSVFAQVFNGAYNASPIWNNIPYQSVNLGGTLSISATAHDDDGDFLTYASVSLPDGASFDANNRVLVFMPRAGQLGTYAATLSVTDNKSQPIYKTIYIGVTDSTYRYATVGGQLDNYYNQAPYFSGTESYFQARSGNSLEFKLRAFDPEGRGVSYSVVNLPAGASFNGANGEFRWMPMYASRGTYNLQFIASDGIVSSAPLNVTIVVDGGIAIINQGVNQVYNYNNQVTVSSVYGQPYFITSAALTVSAGQTYVYNARATDTSGSQITYSLTLAPDGAYLNPTTGMLAWVAPSNAVSAPYRFTITARNSQGLSASQSFDLNVIGGVAKNTTVVRYAAATPVYAQTVTTPTYQPATTYTQASGAFNIAIRPNENNETIVTWDTATPSRGEVVFGFNSQPASRLLNYDFTTGQDEEFATRHQISLGTLQMNRTYYVRVISRTGSATDTSNEVIVIPMPYTDQTGGQVNINQPASQQGGPVYGGASASDSLGSFLGSGWMLAFLLLIIVILSVYLLSTRPRTIAY